MSSDADIAGMMTDALGAIAEFFEGTGHTGLGAAGRILGPIANYAGIAGAIISGELEGKSPLEVVGGIVAGSLATSGVLPAVLASGEVGAAFTALAAASPLAGIVLFAGAVIFAGLAGAVVGEFLGRQLDRLLFKDHFGFNADKLFNDLGDLLRHFRSDPLVLDLYGDGISLIGLDASNTRFDVDGDGAIERVGWVDPSDGLLVFDANQNGQVDGVDELVGNTHVDGFDELATYDSNHDGKIDALDANFAKFLVWRDSNGDGISTSNEISTTEQAGIASFNLSYSASGTESGGNLIARLGSFTRIAGGQRAMASVQFAKDETVTRPVLPTNAAMGDIATLPNLGAYGPIADLRTAMYFDPVLKSMVSNLATQNHDFTSFDDFLQGGFLDVLFRWAGIDIDAPGESEFSLREKFIEAFTGEALDGLGVGQIARVTNAFNAIVSKLGIGFLIQAADREENLLIAEFGNQAANVNPNDPNYLNIIATLANNAASDIFESEPPYDYLKLFSKLSINPSTGEIVGDFNSIVDEFLKQQPAFDWTKTLGAGPPILTAAFSGFILRNILTDTPSVYAEGSWGAWYADQGGILFNIAAAMGISADYVKNVTGWRWISTQAAEIYGTAGNDVLSYSTSTISVTNSSVAQDGGVTYSSSSAITRDQRLYGYAGDDELRGNDGVDTLIGGAGNDNLFGGSGSDMYVYAVNSGLDRITEESGTDDAIFFSSELKSQDLRVIRISGSNDLQLHFGDTSQGIILTNQVNMGNSAVESFSFVGSAILDAGDIATIYLKSLSSEANDIIVGTRAGERIFGLGGNDTLSGWDGDDDISGGDGNDTLNGENGNDILRGRAGDDIFSPGYGNDRVIGGTGNDTIWESDNDDTYVWNLGDGDDVLRNGGFWDGNNTLEFGPGIVAADLVITRVGTGSDVKISVAGQPGSFTLEAGLNRWGDEQIDQIRFADGSTMTRTALYAAAVASQSTAGNDDILGSRLSDVIEGGAGDDVLSPNYGNDRVIGGAGNDTIWESDDNDTYVWNLGDGDDILRNGGFWDGNNTLEFGPGIVAADLVITRVGTGSDVKISVAGQPGSFTLEAGLNRWGDEQIDQIRFIDGSMMTRADLYAAVIASQATAGNDEILGSRLGDTIAAGAGDDVISPNYGNDRVIGGAGNDTIWESDDNDTYVWNLGDGDDILRNGGFWDGNNTLEFGPGIIASDLVITRVGTSYDVKISVAGQPGSFTLEAGLNRWGDEQIDQIRFADGSMMTRAALYAVAVASQSTTGNDDIFGSRLDDLIQGGAGNDTISGNVGNDTIFGGDGNDTIDGNDGNDVLRGGAGDNIIWEGGGDDTYVWNRGDGNDRLQNGGYWDGYNVLQLGADITRADLSFSRVGTSNDIKMSILGEAGSFTFADGLNIYGDAQVDMIRFADGSTMTHAEYATAAAASQGTAGNDNIYGSRFNDVIDGGFGNDIINPNVGNDRVIGGSGDDIIEESEGDDIYIWNLGDGHDIIRNGGSWDGFNTLEFGAGISLADLSFAHSNNTGANLRIGVVGQAGSITIDGWFTGAAGQRIDQLRFADGTTAALASTLSALGNNGIPYVGTSGDDLLTPPSGYGVVDAGAGNDRITLTGNGGGTILFRSSDGADILDNTSSGYTRTDTLKLADVAPDGVVLRKSANELSLTVVATGASFKALQQFSGSGQTFGIGSILFSDGTSWNRNQIWDHTILMGTSGNDALSATGGFYRLHAGLGDDNIALQGSGAGVVEYSRGDGLDVLTNPGSGYVRSDVLHLTDILPSDVTVEKQGSILHVILKDAGDIIKVSSQFLTDGSGNPIVDFGVNEIRFADGTSWNRSTITTKATANDAPNGLDLLTDIAQPASRVGSAVRWTNDTYQLTPPSNNQNGAIWGDVDLSNDAVWTTKMYFGAGDGGADGVAFAFQNAGSAALGTSGVLTATSFGVRFDTWTNPGLEPTSDFSQFVLNGNIGATSSQFDPFHLHANIENGAWHDVNFQWDASTYTLSYSLDGNSVASKTYDAVANLFASDSTVKFGFGAFTGGLNNSQLVQLVSMKQTVAQFSVQEDASSGTLVGYLTGRDADYDEALSYAIVDANGNALSDAFFEIVGGNQLRIRAGAALDFETEAEHLLRIRTTDIAGASRIDDVRVAILNVVAQTLTGTAADDSLNGTGEADTLSGLAGNDWVAGSRGSDVLQGGDGNDTIYGDGRKAVGTNLVVNGGFEDLGITTNNIRRDWGVETADIAGWTKINSQPYEANFSGTQSILASEGTYWLDMMVATGSSAQMDIRQSFDNLATGEAFLLQFDVARPSVAGNATIEALWNGTVIATISTAGVQMKTVSRYVTAAAGSNQLQFRTTAGPNYYGVSLDNVRLFATEASAGGNDQIDGGAGTDVAVFAGNQADYTVSTVNGVVTVTDNQPSMNGDDGIDTLSGIETIAFKDASVNLAAPIVLDLNGDGVSLIDNKRTVVRFDWDGDGRKDQTGWIGKDDGFLFLDRDGNGTVTNAGELSFTSDKEGAKSDLDGLRAFDSNGDGLLSSADDQFSQFKVWRDKNGNGRVDQREILSLENASIASINLTGQAVNKNWAWGENITVNTGSFVRTDGTDGSFSDVALNYSSADVQNVSINRAASQLNEAIASFTDNRGTTAFERFEALLERRYDMLAAARSEWR